MRNQHWHLSSQRLMMRRLPYAVAVIPVLVCGCGGGGTTESADRTPASAETRASGVVPTSLPTVGVSALDGILLSLGDINSAMGATAMTVARSSSKLGDARDAFDVPECVSAITPGQRTLYDGAGWVAARLRKDRDDPFKHEVIQVVVSFVTSEAATAFVAHAEKNLAACVGRRVALVKSGTVYMPGQVSNTDGFLTTLSIVEGGDGWTTQRALTARNNIVIDVAASGYGVREQATRIAADAAARVAAAR